MSESPASEHHAPFKESPKSLGLGNEFRPDDTLTALDNDPGHILRMRRASEYATLGRELSRNEQVRLLATTRDELNSLRDDFQIAVPEFQQFISTSPDGQEALYTRVEKVEGVDLDNITAHPSLYESLLSANEMESWLSNLVAYIRDRYKNDATYMSDLLKPGQYRYGHTGGNPSNRIYLIDVDGQLASLANPDERNSAFIHLGYLWSEFAKLADLPNSRQALTDLLNTAYDNGDIDEYAYNQAWDFIEDTPD